MEIALEYAQAHFAEVADAAAGGERVVVTKGGKPFVELVPVDRAVGADPVVSYFEKAAAIRRELGWEDLTIELPETFDDPAFSRKVLGLKDE